MSVEVKSVEVAAILTRAQGYLREVCSHSLQPYRGCTFGNAACGAACYVRHNVFVTKGRPWGSFLEARVNAAVRYREHAAKERAWGRRARGAFSIFLSSATDPFVPQEARLGITRSVLRAMREDPPDELIVQTHGTGVVAARETLVALAERTRLRVHVSIEGDRDRLPGLPPPAASVAARLAAARALRDAGLFTVVTVAPLWPLAEPDAFFAAVAAAADAVVLDHFVGGDGSAGGARTLRTALPAAIAQVDEQALRLDYRDRAAAIAHRHLPGRVGVGAAGFAGRYLFAPES